MKYFFYSGVFVLVSCFVFRSVSGSQWVKLIDVSNIDISLHVDITWSKSFHQTKSILTAFSQSQTHVVVAKADSSFYLLIIISAKKSLKDLVLAF